MIKSLASFSAWVVFAGLLCFAPCAPGQTSVSANVANAGNGVLNYAAPSFLVFTLSPNNDLKDRQDRRVDRGVGSTCGNQGGGRDSIGRDFGGWGSISGCTSVPEGGTTFMYLSLAGLCCFGAMVLGARRLSRLRETN